MFDFYKCKCPECENMALSRIDPEGKIVNGEGYCLKHCENPEQESEKILGYIASHDKIVGLNAAGLKFDKTDISGKGFYCCNFQYANFSNVKASDIRMRMCFLDYSSFTESYFVNSNIQYTSFGKSRFVLTVFTESELILDNFNGITAYQSSFENSSLQGSRFIGSVLMSSSMSNCQLKNVFFYGSWLDGVNFKSSNTGAAMLERAEVDRKTDSPFKRVIL